MPLVSCWWCIVAESLPCVKSASVVGELENSRILTSPVERLVQQGACVCVCERRMYLLHYFKRINLLCGDIYVYDIYVCVCEVQPNRMFSIWQGR